tara:strand:+ start:2708 stop:3202 length:495 start_codon:yes stop_codon:yes gene_type:complete
MKSVILFRHGKSDWHAPYGNDHERPLANRGVEAAKKMGKFLFEKNQVPELVISSTAVRAKTTVELAIDSAKWTSKLVLERGIYGGSPDFLLELIHSQDDVYNSICLVGHEPNFSFFISRASNQDYINFTTANMAKINFDINMWSKLQFGNGILEWHQKPKDIKQ